MRNFKNLLMAFCFIGVALPISSVAADEKYDYDDILDITVEDLARMQFYSAGKKNDNMNKIPAATFILTNEEIINSGATSIPEVLRLVPGVQVARINASTWAISIRGFNRQYSNKLLVLIDGRSVYTPLFSGVFWDVNDYPMEDIERIEVIKGPGGTLWGSNAVNGVINIITKNARKTQGGYTTATYGNFKRPSVETRYGSKIGEREFFRTYAKYDDNDAFKKSLTENTNNHDAWHKSSGGFRYDKNISPNKKLRVSGDAYEGTKDLINILPSLTTPPYAPAAYADEEFRGWNTIAEYNIMHEGGSETTIKTYLDYAYRQADRVLEHEVFTFDTELQHDFDISSYNNFMYGLGYRAIMDNLTGTTFLGYTPEDKNDTIYSAFVQDKFLIIPGKLTLTIGSKVEYNDYTQFEYQPNVRVGYTVNRNNFVWAAVSKAVRTPSRGEEGINSSFFGTGGGYLMQRGNPDYQSEELIAYEAGYKSIISEKLTYDISVFFNDYDKLRTIQSSGLNYTFYNYGYGETYGFEVSSQYQPTKNWSLTSGYSFLTQTFHTNPGSNDTGLRNDENRSPSNQFSVTSNYNFGHGISMFNAFYFVDNIGFKYSPATNGPGINNYYKVDSKISWKPVKNLELSLIGNNLFNSWHPEFTDYLLSTPSDVPREVLVRVTYKY
jgi:iron complex outermembrane receptor protein